MLLAAGKLTFDLVAHPFRVAVDTLVILFAAFQIFAIGLLADLVVRTNRRGEEAPPSSH
jgi:hypothetical protein